jgi:hypothetical protein
VVTLIPDSNIIPRTTSVGSFAGGALPTATGSGKLVRPCDRMHLEKLSAAVWAEAVIFGGVPELGIRWPQACCARRNDGDWGSMPELGVSWTLPVALGSGKFETPRDRIHAENWSASESAIDLDFAWWLVEEPQADARAAHPTPSSTA